MAGSCSDDGQASARDDADHLAVARALDSNITLPSLVANSVSSLPMLTLVPGWNWVPRWRIRILPASTAS